LIVTRQIWTNGATDSLGQESAVTCVLRHSHDSQAAPATSKNVCLCEWLEAVHPISSIMLIWHDLKSESCPSRFLCPHPSRYKFPFPSPGHTFLSSTFDNSLKARLERFHSPSQQGCVAPDETIICFLVDYTCTHSGVSMYNSNGTTVDRQCSRTCAYRALCFEFETKAQNVWRTLIFTTASRRNPGGDPGRRPDQYSSPAIYSEIEE
jgi:hypothetical protein